MDLNDLSAAERERMVTRAGHLIKHANRAQPWAVTIGPAPLNTAGSWGIGRLQGAAPV